MNVDCLKFNDFLIYVNTFTGNNCLGLSHAHEDLLSYSIFSRGKEVMVDCGRSNYSTKSLTTQEAHNGLQLCDRPIRPAIRWFNRKSAWWGAIGITLGGNLINEWKYSAINKNTGDEKSVQIKFHNHFITIDESYTTNLKKPRFSLIHNYPAQPFFSVEENVFRTDEIVVRYGFKIKAGISKRAQAYQGLGARILVQNHGEICGEGGVVKTSVKIGFLVVSSGKGWLDGWRMIAGDDT